MCHFIVSLVCLLLVPPLFGQSPIRYRLAFPDLPHRYMDVEVTFPNLANEPLELWMSRASPGRYALHEFAKNVYDIRAFDSKGAGLIPARPDPYRWIVAAHDGTVRIHYKIFGDRVDGTYLAVDSTHAHINIPASLLWARSYEERPMEIRLVRPSGSSWRVATQLFTTDDPFTFHAPNLQYLMDSPIEFSDFSDRSFTLRTRASGAGENRRQTFRIAMHHTGTEAELDRFAEDVEKIARESRAIFGEFPRFDTGTYVFIADYLSYAAGDGMEHRNSTILTSSETLGNEEQLLGLLRTVAHELFHAWNVERIRPKSLEPFDFTGTNMAAELWLAEGFTSYYAALILHRAGIAELSETLQTFTEFIDAVTLSPGMKLRSAVQMSQLAPLVDEARSVDPTNWENTFVSYYAFGAAIGLGLDLALRDKTQGRGTLDDFMVAMWRKHGKIGGGVVGRVAAPYTMQDAVDRLAEVSGDRSFARAFFERHVTGLQRVDYEQLLSLAGLKLVRENPNSSWLGGISLGFNDGVAEVTGRVPRGSPAYEAGLEQDDHLVSLDGVAVSSADRLKRFLERRRPGEVVPTTFLRRGQLVTAPLRLTADPRAKIVPKEDAVLTREEKEFRKAWLNTP